VLAVNPEADERLARRASLCAISFLVVREDQVDRAGVDVERFAEELHRHRGALEVPAGAPFADRRLPRGFVSFFAFQSTKSRADSFSYSSASMRLYSLVVSISTFDSFP